METFARGLDREAYFRPLHGSNDFSRECLLMDLDRSAPSYLDTLHDRSLTALREVFVGRYLR